MTQKPYKWLGLLAIVPANAMIFLDQTALPVALPTIQSEMQAGELGLEWSVNSYFLFMAVFALAAGKLSDWIGHRCAFCLGLIVFVLASLLCGMSTNIQWLIAARALQGIGSAFMLPAITALFTALFPAAERGKAMGINVSASSVFLVLGPLIGGLLTQDFSWNWIFWINLPIGFISFLAALRFLPKSKTYRVSIDFWGFAYFIVSAASLVILCMQIRIWGVQSFETLACFLITLVSAILLFRREKTAQHPFLDLALFKKPLFTAIAINISIAQFILMISVFRSIYFQTILEYSPTLAGFVTFLSSSPIFFVSPIAGYLSDRLSPKLPLAIGYLLLIFSFFWLGFFSTPSLPSLLISLFAFGIGVPLLFTPSYTTAMKSVPPPKRGVAFGMIATLRTLAGTMGVALIGLFMNLVENYQQSRLFGTPDAARLSEIAGFSATHFALAFLVILTFAIAFVFHKRHSTHHLPESPAEGWD